jgi:prolipoprotein diacylglyceryltransferase
MRRVLFRWRGVAIYSYPAMLYLGIVAGLVAADAAAHVAGLSAPRVFVATLLLLIPALVGARLLFVLTHWPIYRREPGRIWRRAEGGAALYGGLPLMVLTSVPLLGVLHLPFAAFWDVATFPILVGMVFTRIGCMLNGCCAGHPSEAWFALRLPDHRGIWRRRVPTQLIEAAWGSVLLGGAIALWRHMPFAGALFLYALGGYAVGRLVFEPMREQQEHVARISLHSAISAALVFVSLLSFALAWPR